jgi:hypothetical protein
MKRQYPLIWAAWLTHAVAESGTIYQDLPRFHGRIGSKTPLDAFIFVRYTLTFPRLWFPPVGRVLAKRISL